MEVIADRKSLGGNSTHDAVVINQQNPSYELNWSGNLGTNIYMSSPVFEDARIMTAGFDDGLRYREGLLSFVYGYLWAAERDGHGEGKWHQMDLRTGKSIWSFPTGIQNMGTSAHSGINKNLN